MVGTACERRFRLLPCLRVEVRRGRALLRASRGDRYLGGRHCRQPWTWLASAIAVGAGTLAVRGGGLRPRNHDAIEKAHEVVALDGGRVAAQLAPDSESRRVRDPPGSARYGAGGSAVD